jgi:O-antigen/teichoic acid export membrane protein
MTRLKSFQRALMTGLIGTGASVVYGIFFVPICLAFLDVAQYGMWSLVLQLYRYLEILDFGASGAVFRLMSDSCQSKNKERLARIWTASLAAQGVQGLLILVLGVGVVRLSSSILAIPPERAGEFQFLFLSVVLFGASRFVLRPFGMLVRAHQNHALLNLLTPVGLLGSLVILFLGLRAGLGSSSLIFGFAWEWLFSAIGPCFICLSKSFLPPLTLWRLPLLADIRELFSFGSKLFLVQASTLITQSTPLLIASRLGGLEVAAAWAAGSRVANLIKDCLTQIDSAAAPGIFAMASQGEAKQMQLRLIELAGISLGIGSLLAGLYSSFNYDFIQLWTNHKISFPTIASTGLGFYVVLNAGFHLISLFAQAHYGLGKIALSSLRELFLGPLFSLMGWYVGGLAGLSFAQVICCVIGSFFPGFRLFLQFSGLGFRSILFQLLFPLFGVFFTSLCSGLFFAHISSRPEWLSLVTSVTLGSIVSCLICLGLFWPLFSPAWRMIRRM